MISGFSMLCKEMELSLDILCETRCGFACKNGLRCYNNKMKALTTFLVPLAICFGRFDGPGAALVGLAGGVEASIYEWFCYILQSLSQQTRSSFCMF